jgi:putative ABC transport system ATP-binding protein
VSGASANAATWSLEADGIGRRAPGGPWLLQGASLRVAPGDRVGISGPSGAGKTLLLRALARLDEGRVLWCGQEVRGDHIPEFRRRVVYLSQRAVVFEGSVEANFRQPFALAASRRQSLDAARARSWLDSLGRRADFEAKSHAHLSGGEAQIVALVRALSLDPSVLLLDEAAASLDRDTAAAAERLLVDWTTASERAIVWVSHAPVSSAGFIARSLELRDGRLEAVR